MEILPIHIHFYQKDRFPGHKEEFIKLLDELGVKKVVVFANNTPDETPNDYIVSLKSEYPDRIIGLPEIDLLDKSVLGRMEEYILKYKMSGFKVFPARCYCYPDDKKVFKVYEKAIELDVPIAFHSGRLPGEFPKYGLNKFGQPIYLDEVAARYPKLDIVISHAGNPMFEQTLMIGNRPNINIDICGVSIRDDRFMTLYRLYGADRMLFGGPNHDHRVNFKAEISNTLNQLSARNIDITSQEKIMALNAKRLFCKRD